MSTASLLLVVAATWSTLGFVVALFIGRLLREASPVAEEGGSQLLC